MRGTIMPNRSSAVNAVVPMKFRSRASRTVWPTSALVAVSWAAIIATNKPPAAAVVSAAPRRYARRSPVRSAW